MYEIIDAVSPDRIEQDIATLAGFGTRHTLSDTVSDTRGIGAARRWIKKEFETISKSCGNCLEVFYQKDLVAAGTNGRILEDVWVVNVAAVQRGTKYPNRYIIMSGDIDSRISDPNNAVDDSPGANDNASGMAGVLGQKAEPQLGQTYEAAMHFVHSVQSSITRKTKIHSFLGFQ